MNPFVKQTMATIAELYPDIFHDYFSKRIDYHHPNYVHFSVCQLTLAAHILPTYREHAHEPINQAWITASVKSCQHLHPHYFISQTFMEAVHLTNPDPDITLSTLEMPFPTFTVSLPLNISRRVFGTEIHAITISRLLHQERISIPSLKLDIVNDGSKLNFLGMSLDTTSGLPVQYACMARDIDPASKVGNEEYTDYTDPSDYFGEFENRSLTPEEERSIPAKLATFGIKLLAVLNAEPTFTPHPNAGKKVMGRVSHIVYHQPLWLGNTYTAPAFTIGTHKSPQMHWRRGHVRHQHFGPGLSETKLVWIKPVLVNKQTKQQ